MARILIAEHTQTTAEYLAATLKKGNNSVTVVDNCLDAWRMATQYTYDILMIDVSMPGVDSFVIAQKALQDNPMLEIIFISGFAGVIMNTEATPSYAPAPVTMRPFHLREIAARVRYLMGLGALPAADAPALTEGRVVYADFSNKTEAQQASV